jgi:arginase
MITPLILHVETNLGLRPSGVERLGAVLLDLGLAGRVGGKFAGRLRAPQFDHWRDPVLGARNVPAVAALASEQADRVGEIVDDGGFPVVLGGDDSVLLGCLLALRRRGPAGLVLLDGHTDYWDLPDGSGELSDSDLWIATGHGPDVIAGMALARPLVQSGLVAGMDVTIYNPSLDSADLPAGRVLLDVVTGILT